MHDMIDQRNVETARRDISRDEHAVRCRHNHHAPPPVNAVEVAATAAVADRLCESGRDFSGAAAAQQSVAAARRRRA